MVRASPLALTLLPLLSSVGAVPIIGEIIESLKLKLTPAKLQNDMTTTALKLHIAALQKIADKHDGTRVFGSPGYNASVDYVSTLTKLAGYNVQKQSFPWLFEETLVEKLTAGSLGDVEIGGMSYSPSTPSGGVTARVVAVPDSEAAPSPGCTSGDYTGVDVTGAIALVKRGGCTFAQKTTTAKGQGAVGIIIYNNVPGFLSGTLGEVNDAGFVPAGGISLEDGQMLLSLVNSGPVTATLDLEFFREERWSSNVIASSKAGNQSNVVFIGAHLDSVAAGPGINDDGSGTVLVLDLALQLAKYSLKGKNAVRFGFWTAEEYGLVGSSHYVESLSEEERAKIALYINLDMVASPNYILGVDDSDNSAGHNTIGAGPPGSGAVEAVLQQYFTKNNLPTVPTAFDGRSDYASFIENGIPASGLFTGAEGIMTEEQAKAYNGKAGAPYDPNYHAKGDTKDNINYTAFLHNAKASANAIATFIESTKLVDDQKNAKTSAKVSAASSESTARDDLAITRSSKHDRVAA